MEQSLPERFSSTALLLTLTEGGLSLRVVHPVLGLLGPQQ